MRDIVIFFLCGIINHQHLYGKAIPSSWTPPSYSAGVGGWKFGANGKYEKFVTNHAITSKRVNAQFPFIISASFLAGPYFLVILAALEQLPVMLWRGGDGTILCERKIRAKTVHTKKTPLK